MPHYLITIRFKRRAPLRVVVKADSEEGAYNIADRTFPNADSICIEFRIDRVLE